MFSNLKILLRSQCQRESFAGRAAEAQEVKQHTRIPGWSQKSRSPGPQPSSEGWAQPQCSQGTSAPTPHFILPLFAFRVTACSYTTPRVVAVRLLKKYTVCRMSNEQDLAAARHHTAPCRPAVRSPHSPQGSVPACVQVPLNYNHTSSNGV